VRVKGEKGYITIKGIGNASGADRFEWEKEIPTAEVKDLLKICEPGVIDKTRYLVPAGNGRTWEVDEFYGDNDGLTVAEIELGSEDEKFDKPAWLGQEVTGDVKYYNSMLMKNPYKNWK
jgi:adenylate cyclase